jgi:hypothetical protein
MVSLEGNTITSNDTPLSKTITSLLPEEIEDNKLYQKIFSVKEWFDTHTIQPTMITLEDIIETCYTLTSIVAEKHQVVPILAPDELKILDTGSVLWLPSEFTTDVDTEWMPTLYHILSTSLLGSRLNKINTSSLQDLLGSVPIYYTLSRMNYPEPYRTII